MLSGKKGIAIEQLVVIVIVIMSFLLIAGTLSRFLAKAEDKEAENLCRDSIALRAQTIINVNQEEQDDSDWIHGQVKLIPPLCKTLDKKFSGSREEMMHQIADKMARCWWQFGEGRYEQILHGSELAPTIVNLDQTDNMCFVCSTALIDENDFEPIKKEEFLQYLSTTPHPQIPQMTYLTYIQQYGGPGKIALLEDIQPRHAYGISFLVKNAQLEGDTLGGVFKIGGGLLGAKATAAIFAACAATVGIGCGPIAVVGIAGSFLLAASGASDVKVQVKEALYEAERDASVIIFDDLTVSEKKCFRGDLAGE